MTPNELLEIWKRRIHLARRTHYLCAVYFSRLNTRIGVPVVALTAVAGSTLFASPGRDVDAWILILVGIISLAASVLAALHTFLNAADRAARHHRTAAEFMDMQRDIERVQTFPPPEDELRVFVEELSKRWAKLVAESPTPVQRIYEQVHRAAVREGLVNGRSDPEGVSVVDAPSPGTETGKAAARGNPPKAQASPSATP